MPGAEPLGTVEGLSVARIHHAAAAPPRSNSVLRVSRQRAIRCLAQGHHAGRLVGVLPFSRTIVLELGRADVDEG